MILHQLQRLCDVKSGDWLCVIGWKWQQMKSQWLISRYDPGIWQKRLRETKESLCMTICQPKFKPIKSQIHVFVPASVQNTEHTPLMHNTSKLVNSSVSYKAECRDFRLPTACSPQARHYNLPQGGFNWYICSRKCSAYELHDSYGSQHSGLGCHTVW
jgi:hypothetical protein